MEWLILLVLLVFVVWATTARKKRAEDDFPYKAIDPLFSAAERSFFGVLSQAVKEKAVVFGKVRVADILRPSRGISRSNWQKAFNRISSKHFDYVICSPDTLSVLAVVELDDKSHSTETRVERDQFLESACSAAGVTLYRFKVAASYDINGIRNVIFPPLSDDTSRQQPVEENATVNNQQKQLCPKCSSPLIKKLVKNGEHKGAEFLACSAFPKCRYMAKSNA